MIQHGKLTPFELVMRNLKHCSQDEKYAVAKYLAMECGVQMYTPGDAEKVVQQRLREQANSLLISRLKG